ncbi:GlxA family transcriptional regulator [Nocardia mexicana]|uniref:Transcriptional regulator GlxA family with amidase domain n=1 Tax=Nocardia mexicana TaxID=279262 RepID=A0A370H841_9NOCA|nr:DJ-1/PfpI family protein [Nocardia mexicana]RDI52842.1 transcriptional regulator GlxA family with amidase domain [Nocardia mexicana]
MESARRVLIVAYNDAQILDIACPSGAFDMANRIGARPPYRVEVVSVGGHAVRTSAGITLDSGHLEEVRGPIDTVMVVGGAGTEQAAANPHLLDQIRRLARSSRRIASICTGTYLLAAAGLLEHRRVTTHWGYGDQLAARFPTVAVDTAPLYIRDGNIYTSAGVTSALDLTLSLIADDHGSSPARTVARILVTYLHRPADQAQISMFLSAPAPEDRLVHDLMRYAASHLAEDLTPGALARRAGVSTRHLSRLFTTHTGHTPARAVRRLRAESAAQLIRSTELPMAAIARRCGFGSAQTLRAALLDRYGMNGDTMRKITDMAPDRPGAGGDTSAA